MTIGQKLKYLRNEKGVTQKDLADELNVSFQTVSKWESDINEPDISTLRKLATYFECSLDYLLVEENDNPNVNVTNNSLESSSSNELNKELSNTAVDSYNDSNNKVEEIVVSSDSPKNVEEKDTHARWVCYGWSIAAGLVTLGLLLWATLSYPEWFGMGTGAAITTSIVGGYAIFGMIYCILSGSYLGDVFEWCASRSIRWPGLIFEWSIDGIIWVICMKIFFAIIGFLVGVVMLILAIILCMLLGGVSFPFVLIHNIRTDYEDCDY